MKVKVSKVSSKERAEFRQIYLTFIQTQKHFKEWFRHHELAHTITHKPMTLSN